METKAEYVTRTTSKPKDVRCPDCQQIFGTVVANGSQLVTPTLIISHVRGACSNCGFELSWYSTDRYIERIQLRANGRKP